MKITKADLINKVYATNPNLTKVKAYDAVETVLQLIKNGLENGNDVLLSGFGKFYVRDKSERRGRNPQTGEALMLDARRVVTFKPSGILRKKVNRE
ncbi:MAG: integration host factor subunit alpha [Deltaproteobacteria bacterium]|jgi:integration host factor subunit alpha|nr:integration host factor subunit alpha [Deltaproteobacteria bacterium]